MPWRAVLNRLVRVRVWAIVCKLDRQCRDRLATRPMPPRSRSMQVLVHGARWLLEYKHVNGALPAILRSVRCDPPRCYLFDAPGFRHARRSPDTVSSGHSAPNATCAIPSVTCYRNAHHRYTPCPPSRVLLSALVDKNADDSEELPFLAETPATPSASASARAMSTSGAPDTPQSGADAANAAPSRHVSSRAGMLAPASAAGRDSLSDVADPNTAPVNYFLEAPEYPGGWGSLVAGELVEVSPELWGAVARDVDAGLVQEIIDFLQGECSLVSARGGGAAGEGVQFASCERIQAPQTARASSAVAAALSLTYSLSPAQFATHQAALGGLLACPRVERDVGSVAWSPWASAAEDARLLLVVLLLAKWGSGLPMRAGAGAEGGASAVHAAQGFLQDPGKRARGRTGLLNGNHARGCHGCVDCLPEGGVSRVRG